MQMISRVSDTYQFSSSYTAPTIMPFQTFEDFPPLVSLPLAFAFQVVIASRFAPKFVRVYIAQAVIQECPEVFHHPRLALDPPFW
jgi:hypothetical protein